MGQLTATLGRITVGVALLAAVAVTAVRAQDPAEIRIGVFAPLSGISADVGAQIKAGAQAGSAGLLLLSPAARSGVSLERARLLLSRP